MVGGRTVAVAGLLLSMLAAGCADGVEYAPYVESSPAPAPTMTDTLHLVAEGKVGTQPPNAGEPLRIPVVSAGQLASDQPSAIWGFTWPEDTGAIRGSARVTVDVQGVVLNAATQPSCFWQLQVSVNDGDLESDDGGIAFACLGEPNVVPTGERMLEVEFESASGRFPAGLPATVSLVHLGVESGPDARVEVLTAALERDSTVTLPDLEWPIGLAAVP